MGHDSFSLPVDRGALFDLLRWKNGTFQLRELNLTGDGCGFNGSNNKPSERRRPSMMGFLNMLPEKYNAGLSIRVLQHRIEK